MSKLQSPDESVPGSKHSSGSGGALKLIATANLASLQNSLNKDDYVPPDKTIATVKSVDSLEVPSKSKESKNASPQGSAPPSRQSRNSKHSSSRKAMSKVTSKDKILTKVNTPDSSNLDAYGNRALEKLMTIKNPNKKQAQQP